MAPWPQGGGRCHDWHGAEVGVSGVRSTVYDVEGTQVPAIGSKRAGGLTLDPAGNHYRQTSATRASHGRARCRYRVHAAICV